MKITHQKSHDEYQVHCSQKWVKYYFKKGSWKLHLDLQVQTDFAPRTCSWQWQKWYKSLKYSIICYITGGYHRPNQILHRLSIKTSIYLGHINFYCLLPLGLIVKFTGITLFSMYNYSELIYLLLFPTTQPEGNTENIFNPTEKQWYRPFW